MRVRIENAGTLMSVNYAKGIYEYTLSFIRYSLMVVFSIYWYLGIGLIIQLVVPTASIPPLLYDGIVVGTTLLLTYISWKMIVDELWIKGAYLKRIPPPLHIDQSSTSLSWGEQKTLYSDSSSILVHIKKTKERTEYQSIFQISVKIDDDILFSINTPTFRWVFETAEIVSELLDLPVSYKVSFRFRPEQFVGVDEIHDFFAMPGVDYVKWIDHPIHSKRVSYTVQLLSWYILLGGVFFIAALTL